MPMSGVFGIERYVEVVMDLWQFRREATGNSNEQLSATSGTRVTRRKQVTYMLVSRSACGTGRFDAD